MTPEVTPLVAGNWKMNGTRASLDQIKAMAEGVKGPLSEKVETLICPPATLLYVATALCDDSPLRVTRGLNRSAQILNLLEEIRGEVARDLGPRLRGRMASAAPGKRAQDAWLWANLNLNGAIPMALRYLLLLDSDPYRYGTLAAREEALARIINEATDPLQIHHWGPDQVWTLKELLLRSGLLERPATANR